MDQRTTSKAKRPELQRPLVDSPGEFLAGLRSSNLLPSAELARVERAVGEQGAAMPSGSRGAVWLARRLINAGYITHWQSRQLLTGRNTGFFLGPYKLLRPLARGGMSRVMLAHEVASGRQVVLKVLTRERSQSRSFLERFEREARALAALAHPAFVRLLATGEDRGWHFLALERIEGRDVESLVGEFGVPPLAVAVECICQAAEALGHAHQQGFIHRDFKPSNVLIGPGGRLRLIDLGLVRSLGDEESPTRIHGENILGTVDYMAPEQARDSHVVDARADLYSLGCVLYFLLTGQPPFNEGSLATRLMRHQTSEPPDLERLRSDLPRELAAVCRRLMEKRPADRVSSAAQTVDLLRRFRPRDPQCVAGWVDNAMQRQAAAPAKCTLRGQTPPLVPAACMDTAISSSRFESR